MIKLDFNSFFRKISEAIGITSQKDLAIALGIHSSAISQAKRRDSIPQNWIAQLSIKFDLNPEWIEFGVGQKHLKNLHGSATDFDVIRKVKARLSAGGGSFEVSPEIEGYYSFQKEWLKKKGNASNMVLMDIFGNSMEPELRDRDTVLIDQSRKEILAGAIYAIGIDDTVMVKRVEKLPDKLVLLSENKDYSTIVLQGDEIRNVRILGKVIWICRELN